MNMINEVLCLIALSHSRTYLGFGEGPVVEGFGEGAVEGLMLGTGEGLKDGIGDGFIAPVLRKITFTINLNTSKKKPTIRSNSRLAAEK